MVLLLTLLGLNPRFFLMFLKAMVMAIKEKQQKHPDKTINIFYAGCGPYAPFVTLIAPLFSPKKIQFSLVHLQALLYLRYILLLLS